MNKILLIALVSMVGLTTLTLINLKTDDYLRTNLMTGAATSFCPQPQYRSDAWMNKFLSTLSTIKTDDAQVKFLEEQVHTDSHVFSTAQIVSIFSKITFDSSRLKAMSILNPYILTLTSKNIADILGQIIFSSNKMDSLKLISNTLSDVSNASKKLIINSFVFSSDQAQAADILNAVSPRNCIYGTISEKIAAFIIDLSGSMDYTFQVNGETISRLEFVKAQLTKTLSDQLKPYQKFNIFTFGYNAYQWQNDYIDATPENVQIAINYINQMTTMDYTNISAGLELAFNTSQNLNAIYLLSDGVPNAGIQTVDEIKDYLANQNANRSQKIRVNAVSFIMGGIELQEERNLSFQFLNAIADATNGSFKGISG